MISITREQARKFILSRQGLLGKHRFTGKDGAYKYVRQAGCIQYDPVLRYHYILEERHQVK